MVTLVAKPGIVLVKRFLYRGVAEEWSNKYHFTETAPSNGTDWKTLYDAVIAKEKTLYTSDSHVVRAYGYTNTDNNAVNSFDYTAAAAEVAGTFSDGTATTAPGDAAGWVRWKTPDLNSRGKPIYLRKYFHGIKVQTAAPDSMPTAWITAANTFGTALQGGTGAITGFTVCGPTGAVASNRTASVFVTTRTLKRRGRRPPTP